MKNMKKEVLMNMAGVIMFYLMIVLGLIAIRNRIVCVNGLNGNQESITISR